MLRQFMRTLTLLMSMIGNSLHAVKVINNSSMQISVTDFVFWGLPDGRRTPLKSKLDPGQSDKTKDVAALIVKYKGRKTAFIKLQNHHTIIITDTKHTISSTVQNEQPEDRAQEVTIAQFNEYTKPFLDAVY